MSAQNKLDETALTIANCRFVSPPDASIEVIVTEDQQPVGKPLWTAHVLRTVDGCRSLFLCATGVSAEAAITEVFVKSAESARSYISINGYALLSKSNRHGLSKGKPSLSDSSVTADALDDDLSASSDCESLSDDETVSIMSGAGVKKAKQPGRKSHKGKEDDKTSNRRLSRSRLRSRSGTRSVSRTRSLSCSSSGSSSIADDNDSNELPQARALPQVVPTGFVIRPGAPGVPPPPPGWPPRMPGMPTVGRAPPGQTSMRPLANPARAQSLALHDLILRIHWVGKGYAQVMQRLPASKASLRSTAMSYVRCNPDAFSGTLARDIEALRMPLGSPGGVRLLGTLRSVSVAGEQVDLRHYQGDNLAKLLVQEANNDACIALPKFEVEVTVWNPPSPLPLPPPVSQITKTTERISSRPVSLEGQAADES